MSSQPLLITGIHRSGSTWLGQVVARCPRFGFVWEPLNQETVCYGRFNYRPNTWYPYISDFDCSRQVDAFQRLEQFGFNYLNGLRDIKSLRTLLRYGRDAVNFNRWRCEQRRLLIKDPMAFYSAEWIHRRLNSQVIVLIRNPMAFVASMLRAGWYMPLVDIVNQVELVEAYPSEILDDIHAFLEGSGDCHSVEACTLGWRYIHQVIIMLKEKYSNWLFISHEDLVRLPSKMITEVFNYLREEPGTKLLSYLDNSLSSDQGERGMRRDPAKLLASYEKVLTHEQIKYIRDLCEPELSKLYPGKSF
ncbi:MAG: sulfotransferase domain-containing protein [Verrucomicrobiota bacterium]